MQFDREDDSLSLKLRELRHNPCLMSPLSATICLIFLIFSFATLVVRIPEFVIGLMLAPLFARTQWFVEFLYPTGLGRWGHLFLMRMASKKRKEKYHSRTLEQRIEVVPSKVYIHPISQLLDNLSYLIVSCGDDENIPLVAFVVDCGDARECLEQIDAIRERHYDNRRLELQAILCTHKHHDHTAGNKGLLEYVPKCKVFGAAVERVPCCTDFIKNGDAIDLPKNEGNDMNDLVEVEVICVPGHTRGSVCYVLRPRNDHACFLFTGDTMFSGGGGVPFEADHLPTQRSPPKAGGYIRASAGNHAVERCFAELIFRTNGDMDNDSNVLVFPGHEYTAELLSRQFQPGAGDSSQWSKFSPAVFFRTASQLYVTNHRRALPQGKILTVPSLLSLEVDINPNFRKLRKRGEDIVRAVQVWYRLFARTVIPNEGKGFVPTKPASAKRMISKLESSDSIWNIAVGDIDKPVFTAMYTADLDKVINEMDGGKISLEDAVTKLKAMRDRVEQPVIGRRPIPGTLPNDKLMYSACLALAILGSPPCAMTLSDSQTLNLPPPVAPINTHTISVSKKRILQVLTSLGLIKDNVEGRDLTTMIDILWKESSEYGIPQGCNKADDEVGLEDDCMELGILRWMLFGIEANQPDWFERYCMPCGITHPPRKLSQKHPIQDANLRRTNGELVKHDALTCPLCRDVTGCPQGDGLEQEDEDTKNGVSNHMVNGTAGISPTRQPSPRPQPNEVIRLQFAPLGVRAIGRISSRRQADDSEIELQAVATF